MSEPIGTVTAGSWKAEVYENSLPGDFTVRYLDPSGHIALEEPLSGVSSYHQRQGEIVDRLKKLQEGLTGDDANLADSGEY